MARSDGNFPVVSRLDIDPKIWPQKYYAASQVCRECETAWPISHLFAPSVCCDAPTRTSNNAPDMRWPEAVSSLLTARFDRYYDEYNEGVSDAELVLDEEAVRTGIEELIETTSSMECATENR